MDDVIERVAVLESKVDTIQTTLERIETKLDSVVDDHGQRITRLEAEFKFFKRVGTALWSLIYAAVAGAIGWVIKKG